jgi:hypothetical protein
MSVETKATNDPRTVARDIPGIFDTLFPQLTAGVVSYFNRKSYAAASCSPIPETLVAASSLARAMLFEVAMAACEHQLASQANVDWDACLQVAGDRQRRHFDATIPDTLSAADISAAQWVSSNLVSTINQLRNDGEELIIAPKIPGYQWVASGFGDFSLGKRLVEVKCTNKRFSSADYRQVIMYWLLSYAASMENGATEWTSVILVNPRLNYVLNLTFDEIVGVIGAGRSKVDLLQLFSSMVGDHSERLVAEMRLS